MCQRSRLPKHVAEKNRRPPLGINIRKPNSKHNQGFHFQRAMLKAFGKCGNLRRLPTTSQEERPIEFTVVLDSCLLIPAADCPKRPKIKPNEQKTKRTHATTMAIARQLAHLFACGPDPIPYFRSVGPPTCPFAGPPAHLSAHPPVQGMC